jgi:hypothetical protein
VPVSFAENWQNQDSREIVTIYERPILTANQYVIQIQTATTTGALSLRKEVDLAQLQSQIAMSISEVLPSFREATIRAYIADASGLKNTVELQPYSAQAEAILRESAVIEIRSFISTATELESHRVAFDITFEVWKQLPSQSLEPVELSPELLAQLRKNVFRGVVQRCQQRHGLIIELRKLNNLQSLQEALPIYSLQIQS